MESAEPLPPDRKQLKVHEKTREPAMINKKKFIVSKYDRARDPNGALKGAMRWLREQRKASRNT